MNPRETLVKQLKKLNLLDREIDDGALYDPVSSEPIRYLASKSLVSEPVALEKLSLHLNIPIVTLREPSTRSRAESNQLFKAIDPKMLWNNKVLPLWEENNNAFVAFANPFNLDIKQSLEFLLSRPIQQCIASEEDILNFLARNYPVGPATYDLLSSTSDTYVELIDTNETDEDIDSKDISTPPIVRLTNMILSDGLKSRASDIHIEPLQSSLEVRFRVDGKMRHFIEIPKRLQSYMISRIKLLSGMDISERRRPQDGRFRVRIGEDLVDIRASSVPSVYGEAVVLRLLNSSTKVLSFNELGINSRLEQQLLASLHKDARMLLVTGPTGSGKTTTLYTCLTHLHDNTKNIITVENPIEYRIKGITQIQVNEATGVTFASSLRSILRQDPDVVMIGEIRDRDTATIAVEAAMTGHKVLSTVHTNDAPSAITRLNHLGLSSYSIACALSGVLAQRLVRRICTSCSGKLSAERVEQYTVEIAKYNLTPSELKWGTGCEKCDYTGYRGRTGIYSFLEIDDRVRELLENGATIGAITQHAYTVGYRDLSTAAVEAVKKGLTTLEEVQSYLDSTDSSVKDTVGSVKSSDVVPHPLSQNEAAEFAPKQASGIQRSRILIIEDDPDVRTTLQALLEREQFEVNVAENGLEGLQAVYDKAPTLILCDLKMPIMDGREFMKRLRSNPQTQELPVIILTASDDEKSEIESLDLGAKDFISKASSSNLMLTRLRRILADY